MKQRYAALVILAGLFPSTFVFAQAASVTWGLSSTPLVTSSSGNVVGTSETLSGGSSPVMSIFDYNSNGQRLWVGNTGWVAATPPQEDPLRFLQFDVAPTSGNSFTVTNVSFNYGDFQTSTNFNILKANVYYSTDGWSTRTPLAAGLSYLNTSMSSFSQTVGVTLAAGATFSLRIYPYPVLNGLAMTPTFAIHNTVVINGTTASTLGSICGVKFNDSDGDGVQDPGELGLPNWIINLSYSQATGPVTLIDTTDANGNYCFNSLQPGGVYTVSETNQTGWQQTFPLSPGTHTVTLASGQQIDSLHFGNRQLPTLGSICGMKFNDLDGDGVQDAGEAGLPNWTINLSYNPATGPVTLTTTTDSSGNYCFNSLQGGGSYRVSETNQAGWQQTFPSAPGTHTIALTAGQNVTGINFGNTANAAGGTGACVTWDLSSTNLATSATGAIVGQPESIGGGTSAPFMSLFLPYSGGQRLWSGTTGWVAGTVDPQRYIEFNASATSGNSLTVTNVSFQYGDNPLSTDFNIIKSQVFYSIDGWVNSVPLGTTLSYLNTSTQTFNQSISGGAVVPAGQVFSLRIFPYSTSGSIAGTPSFAIHSNVVICGTTTPEAPTTSSICGMKFNDLDGDGVQDAGEPGLPGWEIKLSYNLATGPVTLTTTTDSSGNYCFNNLQGGGSYTVSETNQTGWQQTFPASPGTHTVTLTAGRNINDINFGNKVDTAGQKETCITWGLLDTNLVTSVVGNIVGQPEILGVGSPLLSTGLPANPMSIYGYSNGQQLWVGHTGGTWVPDPPSTPMLDPLRYIQFDVSPTTGNALTVTSVSFQYGDLPWSSNFNILAFQAFYSNDHWSTSTVLNSTPLVYLNTAMSTFNVTGLSVPVASGSTFSLRIYPYPILHGMTALPSFATHNNVLICGTTAPEVLSTGSLCGVKFNDLNGNGVRDAGEPGLPNWQIGLNVATVPPVLTDSLGRYCFNNLPPGTYIITETQQTGWTQTAPPSPGTHTVTLAQGQNIGNLDFGNKLDPCINGTKTWLPLGSGINGGVFAIAVSGTDLYVGGQFTTAGGGSANNIAQWNGTSWSPLGSGINGTVMAITVSGTDLYAGGTFTTAGGVSANNIAKWDGTTWSALGGGINGTVWAITVSGTDLYAGGAFNTAGGVSANNIAQWNGTAWSALGSGINATVAAITVSGTDLYAGGAFTTAGGVSANNIAKWNGTTWSALGSGINGTVYATAVIGTELFAGGSFTTAGGASASNVAQWNGANWSALGTGMNGSVRGLAGMGTDLYAGGSFTTAGGIPTNRIAPWNGTTWSALGSGMNSSTYALAVSGTDLYAGGGFTTAGGVNVNYIAKYSCGVPTSVYEDRTDNVLPQRFELKQNYPNPFNPGTTIGFGVPVKSFIRLTIYDVLGRHLATLVEGELAAGTYQKYWNASGLPSGVYIYRMEAGAFTESKKLFLLK